MAVPFNLEEELKKRGAKYHTAMLPFASYVIAGVGYLKRDERNALANLILTETEK